MPRKPQPKQRVIFKDGLGRFVKAEDRFKKATTVQVRRGRKWVTVIEDSKVTPKKLAVVTNRVEFESLPPAFKPLKKVDVPKRGKNKMWDAAQKISSVRGVKGKLLKVTVKYKKGGRKHTKSFYHNTSKRKRSDYMLFKNMKETIEGGQLPHWYDIKPTDLNKLEKDKAELLDVDVEEVM